MPRLKYIQRKRRTRLFEKAPAVRSARALRAPRAPATADRIFRVRTYSHAALTWAAARLSAPSGISVAVGGASGAALPDLPALAGAVWLGSRRRRLNRSALCEEVCAKPSFAGPDAALHSVLPVGALLLILWTLGSKELSQRKPLLTFLIGWVGHVLTDALTHAEDARPILWPISEWRLRSPISYWDRSRYARTFTMAEHGTLLLLVAWTISRRIRAPRSFHSPDG